MSHEEILANVEEQRRKQLECMKDYDARLKEAESRADNYFSHSPMYRDYLKLQQSYCHLHSEHEASKEHLGDLIAKYSREGNFEEVNKRVEQGVKAMAKQKEAQ
eukprot:SAG11_NODE_19921_length_456_cov_0.997199_1_plen_103_part_10